MKTLSIILILNLSAYGLCFNPKNLKISENVYDDSSDILWIGGEQVFKLKALLKFEILLKENSNSLSLSAGNMLMIFGGVLIGGFIISITVFKADIFSALPLSLLGSGIVLLFIGSSIEN